MTTQRVNSFAAGALERIVRVDRVVLAIVALVAVIAALRPHALDEALTFTLKSILWITPFLAFSVVVAAYATAAGADRLVARAFAGRPLRMIAAAAFLGALTPFCSCSVIPLVAGALAAGVPLAPVMAFWVSSPIMDPEMFVLYVAVLGVSFTVAKTIAAIGMGLAAGIATLPLSRLGCFPNLLRPGAHAGCAASGCAPSRDEGAVHWRIWAVPARRSEFLSAARSAGWFLGRWLVLAFLIESQMVALIPPETISGTLGSDEWWSIPLAVAVGGPAYLNGYAAAPLIARLLEMGIAPGAAMGFLLAGGVSCIPATIAVWGTVRVRVFVWFATAAAATTLVAAYAYQFAAS